MTRPFRMWLYPLPSILAFVGFAFIYLTSGSSAIGLGLVWLVVGVGFFFGWARHHREWPFGARIANDAGAST